ncbi:hypothetical protein F7725_022775 [Dissostichus mawsoni]|uniref:ADP-ribosylation factor 4 n=1 Tax=Dissostichus mawsoni TaxID=36200 RepID=A0A7J5YZ26_DISMA|nr:hypothetical protein F7725_022775 [Dissostichus mawsoni]
MSIKFIQSDDVVDSTLARTWQSADLRGAVPGSGLIFVVDSNDRERVAESSEELQKMLTEDELKDAVLLVFANKQDLPNALPVSELTEKLGLQALRNKNWHIQSTCATQGSGLYEGLNWLSEALTKN